MYYFYLYDRQGSGSYKYGEAHPCLTLNDAVKGAKSLMNRRRDNLMVMVSQSDVQKEACLYRNVIGRVVRHSKGILYNPRNSTVLYLIEGDGSHDERVSDLHDDMH